MLGIIFAQNWQKLIKKQKGKWLKIMHILLIPRTHMMRPFLRCAHASNYRNCETIYYAFEVLTIAPKNPTCSSSFRVPW